MNGLMHPNHSAQQTKHEKSALSDAGWASGWLEQGNQSAPYCEGSNRVLVLRFILLSPVVLACRISP
jgi:hypothetical protein